MSPKFLSRQTVNLYATKTPDKYRYAPNRLFIGSTSCGFICVIPSVANSNKHKGINTQTSNNMNIFPKTRN
jgi:hypothetical protein